MWGKVDHLPFGIRFSIVMLTYLALSALLSKFVSVALDQAVAIPIGTLISFFVLSGRERFLSHLFYGLCGGVIVFAVLKVFS